MPAGTRTVWVPSPLTTTCAVTVLVWPASLMRDHQRVVVRLAGCELRRAGPDDAARLDRDRRAARLGQRHGDRAVGVDDEDRGGRAVCTPSRSSWSFMATLFPPAAGVTEITLLVTVPARRSAFPRTPRCSPRPAGTRRGAAPRCHGRSSSEPFELATGRAPAEAEPAAAGWPEAELDVDAVVALELFPQPARTSPEAAAAASTAAAGVRVVKPDLFMSCLGLGARARRAAAGRMASGAGR